jgi:hypothetical protein
MVGQISSKTVTLLLVPALPVGMLDQSSFRQGQFFRVQTDITAVPISVGRRDAVSIHADSLLQLVAHPSAEHQRFAHVIWEGQAVLIFESDLIERATLVPAATSRPLSGKRSGVNSLNACASSTR